MQIYGDLHVELNSSCSGIPHCRVNKPPEPQLAYAPWDPQRICAKSAAPSELGKGMAFQRIGCLAF